MPSNSANNLFSSVSGFLHTDSGGKLAPETRRRFFRDPAVREEMKKNGLTTEDIHKLEKGKPLAAGKKERFVDGIQSVFEAHPDRVLTLGGDTRVRLSSEGARVFSKTFVKKVERAASISEAPKQSKALDQKEKQKLAQEQAAHQRNIQENVERIRTGGQVWGPLNMKANTGDKDKLDILEKVLHPDKNKDGRSSGPARAAQPTSPVEFSGASAGYIRTVDRTLPAEPAATPAPIPASEADAAPTPGTNDPPPAATDAPEIG